MNIFVLDADPTAAAHSLGDGHVVKMVLESAQIASAVLHRYGIPAPYKPTHRAHPSVRWAGDSIDNWRWFCAYAGELAAEYARRFGRQHGSVAVIEHARLCVLPAGAVERTPFALAMPDECRDVDAVHAYRRYYAEHKRRGRDGRPIAVWQRGRAAPAWWPAYSAAYPEVPRVAA